jgi:glycosyltransferase involved in cell wall biosynthesis
MRLTLVISSLGGGGGERIMLDLARGWVHRGHQVHVVTLSAPATDVYPLPPGVSRVALDCMGSTGGRIAAPWRGLRRLQRIRSAIRASEPDVVIAFMVPTTVLTILASRGLDVPVLVYELVDPDMEAVGSVYGRLRRWSYPRAAAVLAQTPRAAASLNRLAPGSDVRVAPGFVPPFVLEQSPGPRAPVPPVFLAVGRLAVQKGLDMLLEAFKRVAPELPAWQLRIVGSGPLRDELMAKAEGLGIASRVEWVPRDPRPWDRATRDTVFVLASRYEGFPNVLLEAMAMGLAPVAFDCPSGPAEIISNGVNGVLVPANDVEALASAMRSVASDEVLRRRMAVAAAHDVRRDWSLERTLEVWDALLGHAPAGTHTTPVR